MKKRVLNIILSGIFLIVVINSILAVDVCEPTVSLISQDPYPAIPGEYVKLVFQVSDIETPECQTITFELPEQYPLIFDPDTKRRIDIKAGFYERDFNSFLIAPYRVKVDAGATEGENPIDTKVGYQDNDLVISNQFDLYVEDSLADFEVHIDDYSYTAKELTLEILNIADVDVEALVIEIPKQTNIEIRGSNRIVAGDLDSNEYTTVDFTAVPNDGEIEIKILYTDQTGTRRELAKSVKYDSVYFAPKEDETQSTPTYYYVIGAIVFIIAVWWTFRRRKKKKEKKLRRRGSARL